ncbi:unnamed protein product, partial [Schistocephalus solidus]|uniref:28S ribosomal protein S24, mitochondrial n=1 Tax=Schistocephalus solidus TaxID=70667 RepID=A0A183SCB6_SCHSO
MALPLCGIRIRCGGTPRGGSGRASTLRPFPSPGVVARPGAAPAAPATCALSHLRQVWWYAQGRFRPRQPPAPSPISGLLDSVLTPGSAEEENEFVVHNISSKLCSPVILKVLSHESCINVKEYYPVNLVPSGFPKKP